MTVTEQLSSSNTTPQPEIVHWDALEGDWEFLADNDFIQTGYRVAHDWKECMLSLFKFHNETINIWSHGIGGIVFLCLCFHLLLSGIPTELQPHHEISTHSALLRSYGTLLCHGQHTHFLFALHLAQDSGSSSSEFEDAGFLTGIRIKLRSIRDSSAKLYSVAADTIHELDVKTHQKLHNAKMEIEIAFAEADKVLTAGKNAAAQRISAALHRLDTSVHSLADAGAVPKVLLPFWPIYVFITSAMACLFMSATFHLFYVMSNQYAKLFVQLDYGGILVLIAGSNTPILFYGFYCSPWLFYAYSALSYGSCLVCLTLVLHPTYSSNRFRAYRALSFVLTGLAGVFPAIHLLWEHGTKDEEFNKIFFLLIVMGALYIGGAALYVCRIPERYAPGGFDIWFSSHQLFHICVCLAAFVHYISVMTQYRWRASSMCSASPL